MNNISHAQRELGGVPRGRTYCRGTGWGELCALQNGKKEAAAVVVGQDNGRLPGPTGAIPKRSLSLFYPHTARAQNEWTRSDSQQPCAGGENSKPSACNQTDFFLVLPPAMRISLRIFFFKQILHEHSGAQRSASLSTFQMSPHTATWPQWGATIGADEGPKLPCGLEKKGRRPSRPLDYCLGKPEISGAQDPLLLLLPLCLFCVKTPHTHSYHAPPSAAFPDNFHKIILLTHSRSSIQVFSHFPLSFHSAVAPCAPPPAIHSGPSPRFSHPLPSPEGGGRTGGGGGGVKGGVFILKQRLPPRCCGKRKSRAASCQSEWLK